MKKILLSIGSILFAGALLAGGTGAFLGDAQTSTGNTFASGIVDLMVDNESYVTNDLGKLVSSPSTSWALSKLPGKLFFNFQDVKPGDIGEDTISLHVSTNNAWSCMAINLTGTPENGQPEPEVAVDPTIGTNDGELQNYLYFVFWADDGDNVYEQGEKIFKAGLVKDIFNGQNWALADTGTNIWGTPGPLLAGTTKYIGKAWCFGTISQTPLAQDGVGKTTSSTNGPLVRGTGFKCDGAGVGNIVQSDGIKADVSFSVSQSRNNDGFLCTGNDPHDPPPTATSTLFSENFNDCTKDTNEDDNDHEYNHYSWSKKWTCHTNNDENKCTQNLALNAGGTNHTASLSTPNFSTTGYHTITLKYDRATSGGASTKLVVEYSVNGGSTWTTLETVNGNSANTSKTFSLSPLADNKTSVQVRFTVTGTSASNTATIDNVLVTGVTP
jgi:hypothetical protein